MSSLPPTDRSGSDGRPAGDVERIAAAACQQDPGLPHETAVLLARAALPLLEQVGPDAPEIARRLMAAHPGIGATPANVVALAASRAGGGGPAEP